MADQMQDPAMQEQGEGGGEGQGGGGEQLTALLQNLTQGIAMLNEVASQVDPALGERVSAVQAEMDGIVEQIASGGQAPGGAQGAQPAAMEAGAGGQPQTMATR